MAEVRPDEFRRALHMTDAEGSTPLHRAVVLDYAELVEFLIDKVTVINQRKMNLSTL